MASLPLITQKQFVEECPGAKMSFYEPGTTQMKNTFTDNRNEICNVNPIILDAMGGFDVFLKAGEKYKIDFRWEPKKYRYRTIKEDLSADDIPASIAFFQGISRDVKEMKKNKKYW